MTVPGGSPLNYPPGAQPAVRRITRARSPTANDYKNFREGDEWLDKSSDDWYKLADITGPVALWVKIGGSGGAAETFIPDGGTSPVVPDATNQLTFTGSQVAAGTVGANVIDTLGGTNTITWQIQRAAAAASTDSINNGVCHFDSASFTVDANGFVALIGGGAAIDSFIVSSGTSPVVPDGAGQITFTDGNGVGFTGGVNAITGAMVSPFTGDFTFATSTVSITKAASGEWLDFSDGTDVFGYYNNAGTPEAVVAADIGSICTDTTSGNLYIKRTDTANTGWELIPVQVGPTSWTPTLKGSTTGGAGTYTLQTGNYWQHGSMITATATMTWTAHTAAGEAMRVDLPVPDGGAPRTVSGNITASGFAWPAGRTQVTMQGVGSAQADVIVSGTSTTTTNMVLPAAGTLTYTYTYFTS